VKKQWKLLVVDDEPVMRESMAAWLSEDGYTTHTASSGEQAIELARGTPYAICFVDLKMPKGLDGLETMAELRAQQPQAAVVIMTAYATVDTAIAAMKEGAAEYVVKPCNPQEISLLVERIIKVKNLERENTYLRKRLTKRYSFQDIVSKSPAMDHIFELIKQVADLRTTVLVQGESGTGKEMIARALHYAGNRATKPFIAVSCAALTETLLESELFGHERGSFTGAVASKKGKFELASGGSIFLDEIGDISAKLQADLLRVLQERKFYRVGGTTELEVDVRVIAATNRNLLEAVQKGEFRDDLYYRLNVIGIRLPPLRERPEDVPLLARHFLERLAVEINRGGFELTDAALRLLMAHPWPGNVRELENAIERAVVTAQSPRLDASDFAFLSQQAGAEPAWTPPVGLSLTEIERRVIEHTLQRTGWNVREAAGVLGIDRSTLYDKIKRYDLARASDPRSSDDA
jgi:DNA-binding NtrC family response regulator